MKKAVFIRGEGLNPRRTGGPSSAARLLIFISVILFGACSNPVLKWIDTPAARAINSGDKEIISFTFGLGSEKENDLPISRTLDQRGNIPISIILTGVDSLTNLTPEILFIGESINPEPGQAQDFSLSVTNPVVYTVTAQDGSTRTYGVSVYLRGESDKEIVRFTVDVSSGLTAEGIINQKTGTITVSVPSDTVTENLTVHIIHTGKTVQDPEGHFYTASTFDMSGDFSTPGEWIVTAHDDGTKNYTVTVDRKQSDAREITSFGFHLTGEEDIIGAEPQPDGKYLILVVLPQAGYAAVDGGNRLPFIDFTGVSISPTEESPLIFTNPLSLPSYTVAAENGSTRDYVVRVIKKDIPADHEAEITGFYITNPLIQGLIDQTARTISLAIPEGTDLHSLRPEIYYRGASVSPRSGQPQDFTGSDTAPVVYTVRARDGSSQPYDVSVYTIPAPAPTVQTGTETADVGVGTNESGNYNIIVEFPIHIENPVININYPGSGEKNVTINKEYINNEYINNMYYETTVNDDDTVVIINPPADPPALPPDPLNSDAWIDCFYFTNPAAIGAIGSGATGTDTDPIPIMVTVPYGTDRRNLIATIIYTGKRIEGVPGNSPLKDGPRNFQTAVNYVVTAENDTRKYYRVDVTVTPDTAKEITAFSFVEVSPTNVLISGAANGADKYPIAITVPKETDLSGLKPMITYTGVSITGSGVNDTSGPGTVTGTSAVNFSSSDSSPVNYTVTAQDGSDKTYAVTVRAEEPETIEITGFYFTEPLAVGKINQDANLINVTVPSGTMLESLKPTVYFTGMNLNPGSGMANNFASPATYTVTGRSGKTRTYSVVVSAVPSNTKDITRFRLSGVVNSGLIIGAAPDADGLYSISVQVPAGTNLGSLETEITHTGVSISPAAGAPRDFNNPQNYTVRAEDGSVKTYKVTVYPANPGAKLITSLIFNTVPLTGGGTVRVAAAIDQDRKTITAVVPQDATITALRPSITYIGKLIKDPGGGSHSDNPFTDTGKDFSGAQTYTVEDQNGSSEAYTVRVTRQSGFTVTFEGEAERRVIASNTFDPTTGIITVTINTAEVDGPYDWYIDGVKQEGSGSTFSVNVGNGSFYPGRYEIMASGVKGNLRYTGKVYFVVAGGS
ncbi:MAG: DUF5018 domain-containing protein [Treponema sp.]|jgi:hypothetical protein|nr:DUF5018 domain-containing protein [Treponema sp.]